MPNQPDPQEKPAQDVAALQKQLDELKQRYDSSSEEGKRLAAENKRLADENRNMHLTAAGGGHEADPDREALEESGFDVGALERFISKHGSAAGREGAQDTLRPVYNDARARQAVPAELRNDADELLGSNPDVAAAYTALLNSNLADPAAAAGAYLAGQARAHKIDTDMRREADEKAAKRERDKADSTIISGQTTSDRRGDDNSDEDAEQAAAKRKVLLERAQRLGGFDKAIASEFLKGKITRIDRLDQGPRVI